LTLFKPTFRGVGFIAGRWAAFRLQRKSVCDHLIGRRYQRCHQLVLEAMQAMGLDAPSDQPDWYSLGMKGILREVKKYGDAVDAPAYDGDVVLLASDPPALGVTWQNGILYLNRLTGTADWKPVSALTILRSYRMKSR
jgi:hypothetical protein